MKKSVSVFICSLFIATAVHAQSFSPDRPGIGTGSFITPKNMLGVEMGIQARHTDFSRQIDFGQLLIRYGLVENLEVRAFLNSYSSLKFDMSPSANKGFQDMGIGVKYNIQSNEESDFNFSFLTDLSLPLGDDAFTMSEYVSSMGLLMDYGINERWSFSSNMTYSFGVANLEDSFLLTATPSFQIKGNENANVYFGYAGIFDGNSYHQHFLEVGGAVNLDSGIQIDINAGYEIDRVALFMGAGISVGLF